MTKDFLSGLLTCKLFCILCWHRPEMPQITLISNQHNDNIGIRVIPQFFQPSLHILICLMLADIIHQQSTHCSTIVRRCNGTVTFLAGRIPDLRLDGFGVNLYGAGCKLNTNRGFGVEVEFVPGEPRE